MSITTQLTDFRYDMSADIIQLPDTVWLRWYNDWRDKIIDAIIEEKEDYSQELEELCTMFVTLCKASNLDEPENNLPSKRDIDQCIELICSALRSVNIYSDVNSDAGSATVSNFRTGFDFESNLLSIDEVIIATKAPEKQTANEYKNKIKNARARIFDLNRNDKKRRKKE